MFASREWIYQKALGLIVVLSTGPATSLATHVSSRLPLSSGVLGAAVDRRSEFGPRSRRGKALEFREAHRLLLTQILFELAGRKHPELPTNGIQDVLVRRLFRRMEAEHVHIGRPCRTFDPFLIRRIPRPRSRSNIEPRHRWLGLGPALIPSRRLYLDLCLPGSVEKIPGIPLLSILIRAYGSQRLPDQPLGEDASVTVLNEVSRGPPLKGVDI